MSDVAEDEEALLAQRRRAVIHEHARMGRHGKPIFCKPSRAEREGVEPRKQGPRTDGKPIYDTREIADEVARLLEPLGAGPLRPFPCNRSRNGHFHLTGDRGRINRIRRGLGT
jgi:hypothetical protein